MATQPNNPPQKAALLRRADQALLAAITLASLLAMGGYWLTQVVISRRAIDIDHSQGQMAQYQVDVNSADWTEFLQLPDIGESLARQIVAYRQSHGPFKEVSDLRLVKGIGKKRMENMLPYVRVGPPRKPDETPVETPSEPLGVPSQGGRT